MRACGAGVLYMLAAGVVFTGMFALVKLVRVELSPLEILVWRGIVSVPLSLAFAYRVGLRLRRRGLFVARVGFGFVSLVGFFYAAKGLLVADLSLLSKLHPLVIALLAPVFFGRAERAGPVVWLLLLMGLIGCVFILAPELAVGSLYGVVALGAAVSAALGHLCVRGLMRDNDARVVVFYFHVAIVVLAAVSIGLTSGRLPMPEPALWPYLLAIGACASIGQVLLTQAFAEDRAPVVAAAQYVAPLWAVVIDLAIFAALPNWHVWTGGALIVGAGLMLLFLRDPASPA